MDIGVWPEKITRALARVPVWKLRSCLGGHHAVPAMGGVGVKPELIEGSHDDVIDRSEERRVGKECRL